MNCCSDFTTDSSVKKCFLSVEMLDCKSGSISVYKFILKDTVWCITYKHITPMRETLEQQIELERDEFSDAVFFLE